RLLCVGAPPSEGLRWPDVPATWVPPGATPEVDAWARDGGAAIAVVLDAATVVDRTTVAALAATQADGVLRTAGLDLWRVPRAALAGLLERLDGPDASAASDEVWTPPPNATLVTAHDAA